MDKENFFEVSPKKAVPKIDDFTNYKENTMDFLSHERDEKIDAEKPKADVDDFLNFHDDLEDVKSHVKSSPVLIPSFDEPRIQPEADYHPVDDEFLSPHAASDLKGSNEKEKFISSEDLLTDFKDPVPTAAEVHFEPPKVVEAPKDIEAPKAVVPEKPPVVEPVKPVAEPPKPPKSAPPPAPIKKPTSDDTQIEAEKIFKSIGLG